MRYVDCVHLEFVCCSFYQKLQYWNFFLVLAVFIALDLVFLCIWTGPNWRLRHAIYSYPPTPEDIILSQDYCECESRVLFEGALLVMKALLIIFGFFLAYESRNVQYMHLTDSRYTSYAMFVVVSVFVVLGIPTGVLYFVMRIDTYIWSYVFTNLLVILATTGGLLALFIPRVSTPYTQTHSMMHHTKTGFSHPPLILSPVPSCSTG